MYGDSDDGYVLNLGNAPTDVRAMLAAGAVWFNRPDFKSLAGEYSETAWWMLGEHGRQAFDRISADASPLASHAFRESGYYLLQAGDSKPTGGVSVFIDCAELGFQSIAAHGHADALSFTMRAFGREVLVDPGTYDYFTYPAWRDYFRSTRAHNTVAVDDEDQSVMLGPFMWGERARTRCLEWTPSDAGGRFTGEHDGYRRLADPVLHRRTLELEDHGRLLTVTDVLEMQGEHSVSVYFHLAESCRIARHEGQRFVVDIGDNREVILDFDAGLSIAVMQGSESPIAGWVSRCYHGRAAATTLKGTAVCKGTRQFVCRITTRS
jgi:hypothetical protein